MVEIALVYLLIFGILIAVGIAQKPKGKNWKRLDFTDN